MATTTSAASAASNRPRPVLAEVASVPRRYLVPSFAADRRLAPILQNEARRSWPHGGDVHAVFQEMEDKDGHFFAVLQTRKLGLLSRPARLHAPDGPGEAGDFPAAVLALAERALARLDGFRQALFGMLDALAKGVAITEVMWSIEPDGAVLPAALLPRWPGRFRFEESGRLLRVDPGDPLEGTPLPDRKFLVTCFQPQHGNPAALGLAARAYWYSWFKRNNLKSWALYNEKFGSPTVVARFPPGADEAERRQLLDVIDAIQQDAGVTVPEEMRLELLEAGRSGSADTYRQLADWCNDEISKIVLGQTLTTGEGRRSGSLALGRVHEAIRHEYVQADAAMLECVVSRLLRWVVDFNFGDRTPAPRWRIDTSNPAEMAENLKIDRELIGLGLPLGTDYFYERYGRPVPDARQAIINYDDRNIFQYHLRFGVLTINEVRERMGLEPVPWGDRRTGDGTSAGAEGGDSEREHGGRSIEESARREEPRERDPERGDGTGV